MDFTREFEIGVGEMGIDPFKFWMLTPSELFVMIEGYHKKQDIKIKNKIDEILYTAWYTNALARTETLPKLEDFVDNVDKKEDKVKTQTAEDMIHMAKFMTAIFGGEILET